MYEIKTPILAKSAQIALDAAEGVMSGALEPKLANSAIGGSRAIQGAVRADVVARLAEPKIRFLESKQAAAEHPVPANAA